MLGAIRHMSRRLEPALAAFSRAVELDPQHIQARRAQAAVLAELGRNCEALASYRQALTFSPDDPQLLVNIGLLLEAMGEGEDALRHYDSALAIDPGFLAALLNQGVALTLARRLDEWKALIKPCGTNMRPASRQSHFMSLVRTPHFLV